MKRIKILLLALVVMGAFAGHASAQNILVTRGANGSIAGLRIPVWNSSDSLIVSGMVVQLDTTTAATSDLKVFVVKRYTGTLSDRDRVIGVAAGNIARSSQGGNGSVLIYGYHPGVFASVSNATAGSYIRLSTINGAVKDAGDSLSMAVGWCISPVTGTTSAAQGSNTRYRVKAFVNFLTSKIIGAL